VNIVARIPLLEAIAAFEKPSNQNIEFEPSTSEA
jgi:hypothetical protein